MFVTPCAGRFVTCSGSLVRAEELVIPVDAASALIMSTSNAPALELTGEFRSQALLLLGARSRPNTDDIKRASSLLSAAAKSGWSDEVTLQSQKLLATAASAVDSVSLLICAVQSEFDAGLMDAAARAISASAQLMSCASLEVSVVTLPK
jgi:hypothetical protein